jgi:membrane peptidoglycan carboxypeptidase
VQVLKNMVDMGTLSPEQYEEQKQLLLKNLPIKRLVTNNEMRERDSRLEDAYNKEVRSLDQSDIERIELTLNPEKQEQATEIVNARIHTINTEDLSEQ